MAKLTSHPLAAHPLMPPSPNSSAAAEDGEKGQVILPFSKRAIDTTDAAETEGINHLMATDDTEAVSRATAVPVQIVALPSDDEEQRNGGSHFSTSTTAATATAAKPTSSSSRNSTQTSAKTSIKNKKLEQINQLPRSIRWRLNLGLLTMPSSDNATTTNNNTTTAEDKASINLPAKDLIFNRPRHFLVAVNNKSSQEESSAAAAVASLLQYIEDTNALKLRCQRSRYEELEQKHYYSNTIMGIADGIQQEDSKTTTASAAAAGEQMKQSSSQLQQSQSHHDVSEATSPISSLAKSKMHHVAPGDDPLSAALLATSNNNNSNNTNNQGNGMFGFGKGNRHKKNQSIGAEEKHVSEGDTASTANTNANQNGTATTKTTTTTTDTKLEKTAATCKGSRWADYYSTREVLDVIEKDLNRLPNDHYTIYHEWKRYNDDELIRKRVESGGGASGSISNTHQSGVETSAAAAAASASLLSSSAPTKRGERRPGRQKNRFANSFNLKDSFNFGSNGNFLNNNNPNVVQNSNNGHGGGDSKNAFWSNLISNQDYDPEVDAGGVDNPEVSRKERADRLSQLLFVYASEHPEIGYRQGMHETLSFILLALEMDLLDQCVQKEKKNWKQLDLLRKSSGSGGGGMAGVDSFGQIVKVRLLDQNYLLHDAFALFECVMSALAPAYDAIPSGADHCIAAMLEKAKVERGESPMEAMVSKIMSKIRFVARDEALFGIVLCMPVPPQIYFAKWVRLMFGREVSGGMKHVMRLWDAFFDLAAKIEHREEEITLSLALINVLETAAASMIILIRDKLLKPSMARDGSLTAEPDPNDGIAYLMNYPPIEDIDNLIKLISSLLLKEKSLSQMYERRRSQEEDERYVKTAEPEDPFVTGSGRIHDQNRPRQVAPLSPETAQPQLYAHQPKVDVAESIGHFAAGLIDIGTRTVDAAISTYQKHQAEKQHQSGVIDHPLQFGFNTPSRDKTDQGIGRNDDTYAVTYRNHTDAEPLEGQDIIVYKTELRDSQTSEHSQKEEPRRLTGNDTNNLSSSFTTVGVASQGSNGSSSQFRKSPKYLAQKLDKSVKTLMTHFEQQQRNMADDLPTSSTAAAGGTRIIPEEIWEAMAAIESVKKELLTQDALETLER